MASTTAGNSHIISNLNLGADAAGVDLKVFGDTASQYFMWDASADKVILSGKATVGLAQGATGVALSGTDPDQVFQAHGYISAAVAAGAYAGAYVTNTVTATQSNNVSVFGTWSELYITGGTIVLISNHAAVWGNLEISGTVTLPGGIGWHGGVVGTVISPSTLTVSSGGILAGLIADSQMTAGYTATGAFVAGLAIRAGTSKPWAIGIYMEPAATSQAIQIGSLSSDAQTGFHLTATNNNVVDSFADDNDTTLTNAVYSNIRARTMLFKSATGITLVSLKGQIKSDDAVDFGPGVYAGVQGYMELVDESDVQDGAKYWGVDSSIDVPSGGTIDVKSGGIAAGLHAELTGAGTATQTSGGILAGLYIDEQITSGNWGYGIYLRNAAIGIFLHPVGCVLGIKAGSAGTTANSGFLPATDAPFGFYFDDHGSAIATYKECFNIGYVQVTASTSATAGLSALHVYVDQRANFTGGVDVGMSALWASYLLNNSAVADGCDNEGFSALNLSVDVNAGTTLQTGSTLACITFGGNWPGTVSGLIVPMMVRNENYPFSAFAKIDCDGCYQDGAAGSGGTKHLKVYLGSVLYTIEMVTA